ncbi:unnamed protein product, partial [Musa textilis]
QTHQDALIPVAGKSIRSSRNLHGVFVEAQLTGRRRSCRALLHASASNLHVAKVAKEMCKGRRNLSSSCFLDSVFSWSSTVGRGICTICTACQEMSRRQLIICNAFNMLEENTKPPLPPPTLDSVK